MLWEILKASKGILVADFYADLWTPVDVFVEMIGSLPLYYNGKGYDLTDYLISGNTVQDGTPSADAPVDATGCGVWDETRQSYKLPLTVNGTEYPIYLGTVPTTRRVKKLVLTGEERWSANWRPATGTYATLLVDDANKIADSSLCTHVEAKTYEQVYRGTIGVSVVPGSIYLIAMRVPDTLARNDADFKSYLAAQYAAGTPVTVWYVLAEPETGIVNEPLMKIGDYADTISFAQAGVTIPTVSGANVLDMASPVKPSEVYIKGKGIKPTGYGQLADVNGVNILDKDGRPIYGRASDRR